MARFDNQVALVTGAGRGIGAAVAMRLASEGATVAVVDRDDEPARSVVGEIASLGGRAKAIACDVISEAAASISSGQLRQKSR